MFELGVKLSYISGCGKFTLFASPGLLFRSNINWLPFLRKISNVIPMGRMSYKDEYKGAIQFLSSDASSYMNGSIMIMDGGRSVW